MITKGERAMFSPTTLVSLFHVLNDGFRLAMIAFVPYLAESLKLSYAQAGFLTTCLVGIQALTTFPASMIARKKGDLIVLQSGLVVYSVSILALRTVNLYVLLLIVYALAGLGFSAFHPVGSAYIAKNTPKGKLGKSLGVMTSAGDIGKIVVPALSTFLLAKLGWPPTTSLVGGLGVLFFLVSFTLPAGRQKSTVMEKAAESVRNFVRRINRAMIKRNLAFSYALTVSALDCFTQEPMNVFLPFFAFSISGDQQAVGMTLSSYFGGSLVGKNLLGLLADNKGGFSALIVAEIGLSLSLIGISFSNNTYLLYVLAFILGIFSKGTSPVIKSMLGESTRTDSYNLIFGISETSDAVAGAVSPLLFGFLADLTDLRFVFWGEIFFIAATVGMAFMYRTEKRKVFG